MDGTQKETITLVGIGSSAGGLEAIRELVATLPVDINVSYVVVQHMSPNHKSLMTELVGRQTSLKVDDVVDGLVPQPNVIYITPPKTDVLVEDGKLRLVDPSPQVGSPKPSVDRFLLSLADSQGEKSMAIILSGTGSDGATGVQAIREAGGITIAQDVESAKYDGMPQAAVQTGCIDLILRPQEIGTHLQKILTLPRDFESFHQSGADKSPVSDLLQILLARTRVDFRDYKQTTINRRIERRMVALGIESQEEYTQFCRDNPSAVDALFKDLLISVTRFFRDKEEFEHLKQLLPTLLEENTDGPLRVWIAGCATGEETYSIAMLLCEALGGPKVHLKDHVQIFATDIDKDALQVARRGVYSVAALNDIPKSLSDRYFIQQNDGIRVIESLRSAILFSDHNVCQDPPFQKVDLLCCRNLLIYFGNTLQQKVMSRFHYAMADNALMFLGTAESVAGSDELFIQIDSKSHIFRKRSLRRSGTALYSRNRAPRVDQDIKLQGPARIEHSTERQMFEALALSLGKNSVLVTDEYSIVRVYGNVSPFIEMSESSNLKMHIDLLRRPFREEARSLVTLALKNGSMRSGVRHLVSEGSDAAVRLDVYPIIAKDINERAALVVFTELEVDAKVAKSTELKVKHAGEESDRIRHLEDEIATTREALQQTIEELETSNEELQSLNEELQSTNEELQATNEELETSNEELQSTNEELITVNEELQVTTAELSGRTGELMSVLETAPLSIMVLDTALQITHATIAAASMFGLAKPIVHPHVSQCVLPENFPQLAAICNESLKLGEVITREFASGGAQYKLTCSPFFDMRGQMTGVTMVVSEFPGLAKEMDLVLDNSQVFIVNRASDGKIMRLSDRAARALGTTRREAEGKNFFELASPKVAEVERALDQELLDSGVDRIDNIVSIDADDDGGNEKRWMASERFVFSGPSLPNPSIYSIGTDITELVKARNQAQDVTSQLLLLQDVAKIGYWSLDILTEEVFWSDEVYRIHGERPNGFDLNLEKGLSYYHPEDVEDVKNQVGKVVQNGGEFRFVKRLVRRDGEVVEIESSGLATIDQDGKVKKVVGVIRALQADQ